MGEDGYVGLDSAGELFVWKFGKNMCAKSGSHKRPISQRGIGGQVKIQRKKEGGSRQGKRSQKGPRLIPRLRS